MEAFTTFAEKLANVAGDIARAAFRSTQTIAQKADKSFVTDTDKAIESALRVLIEQTYPDHGIFGEEHGRTNADASYQWVIDPIDGTNAFIAGIPTFTTLIALCIDGIPTLGVIDQPILRERWSSATLKPSTINHQLPTSLLATTSMAYFTESEMKKFAHLRNHCGGSVHAGDAYLYGKLASGSIGIVADSGLKPYDFCAVVPVVQAAGGVISDWAGKPLHLHSDGTVLAAANAELHAQALRLLNG